MKIAKYAKFSAKPKSVRLYLLQNYSSFVPMFHKTRGIVSSYRDVEDLLVKHSDIDSIYSNLSSFFYFL